MYQRMPGVIDTAVGYSQVGVCCLCVCILVYACCVGVMDTAVGYSQVGVCCLCVCNALCIRCMSNSHDSPVQALIDVSTIRMANNIVSPVYMYIKVHT